MMCHLAMCHLANIGYRAGNKLLNIDPQTERITNNPQANRLLKPEYRSPYTIGDVV